MLHLLDSSSCLPSNSDRKTNHATPFYSQTTPQQSPFRGRLLFDGAATESDASFYLDTKGVAIHLRIAKHLGFDSNDSTQKIEWSRISSLLRYDKKLRDKIYIYLSTLEEYIRVYISNTYEDDLNQTFWTKGTQNKKGISDRITVGEKVSEILENLVFNELMQQVEQLPQKDKDTLFYAIPQLSKNLNAVHKLRNAVSHHAFL